MDVERMKKSGLGFAAVAFFGGLAAVAFVLAMHCFPGGYNPQRGMLARGGRRRRDALRVAKGV